KSYAACGGVIWDSKNILSASHCFLQCKGGKTKAAKKVTYCVGEHNTKKKDGEKCFDAAKWINHHGYKPCSKHFKNDITVVKMKKPLKLPGLKKGAGSINSACHPTNSLKPKTVTLSGWGRTSRKSTSGSNVLKTINLPVWTTKKCKKKWPKVDNSQICVGGVANQNSCQGDSGGPIVAMKGGKAYVVGLSSFGPTPCAKKGWPNVFTRIAHFNSWIKQKTR
ncbi:serine protease easter-like protein, partial [Leptotrombidium deliense]